MQMTICQTTQLTLISGSQRSLNIGTDQCSLQQCSLHSTTPAKPLVATMRSSVTECASQPLTHSRTPQVGPRTHAQLHKQPSCHQHGSGSGAQARTPRWCVVDAMRSTRQSTALQIHRHVYFHTHLCPAGAFASKDRKLPFSQTRPYQLD
jgi:hypothetical protein